MKKTLLLLLFILALGTFLRFFQLGSIPNSLNWDEVSWGYNAYSIATTGKDEYGDFLPLSFKAFGDYKQPVYVYLDSLPTLFFGLNGFAVRFPSALFGSLTILSVFFLVKELFYKEKKREVLALITASLFAISPWSIQFSRVAFEASVGIFFTITGVSIFFHGFNKQKLWPMVAGTIIMSISCYTYHSQKIFTPLLFIGLIIFASQFLLKQKKRLLILLLVFFIANIFWIIDTRTTARGRSVMFTSHQTEILSDSSQKLISDAQIGDHLGLIFHNRRLVYASKYVENYLSHWDFNYLFITGDNPRHHPPGMGILYLVSLPFILVGMVVLWKKHKPISYIILYWFFIAPLASALAVDAPNASRSMVFLPTWEIFAGLGILSFVQFMTQYLKSFLIICAAILIYFCNFFYYTHWYFGHTDTEYASYWQYGYREAIKETKETKRVYFANDIEQPYIFFLFYNRISPKDYQESGGSNRIWSKCFSIRNAFFGNCEENVQPGDIIVTSKQGLSKVSLAKWKEIHYPNDEVAIRLFVVSK